MRTGVVIEDVRGAVLGFDDGARALFALARGAQPPHVLDALLTEEGRAVHARALAEARAGRAQPYTHVDIVGGDGHRERVDVSFSPLVSPDGQIDAISVVFRSRAPSEPAALVDLRALSPILSGALLCVRQDDGGGVNVSYASPSFAELVGLAPDALPLDATKLLAHVEAADVSRVLEDVREAGTALTPLQTAFRVRHPQRGEVWIEGRAHAEREGDGATVWRASLSDVTSQRQTAEALREARSQLNATLSAGQLGTFVWNLREQTTTFDDAACRVWGAAGGTMNDLADAAVLALIAPIDRAAVEEARRRAVRGASEELYATFRVASASGVRWLLMRGRTQRDNDEGRMLGVVMDVTSQKTLQEAVRASEQRFEQAFRLNPAGNMLVRIADWSVVDANDAYVAMSGAKRQEVIGKTVDSLPALPTHPREVITRRLESTHSQANTEYSFSRRDGSIGYGLLGAECMMLGQEAYAMIVLVDVTVRRKTEDALRASESQLRQLAESIHEVFWLTDASKSRMCYVSPAYDEIWGRDAKRLYENPGEWLDAIHPEDRENVLAALSTQMLGIYDEEYRIVRPDGEIRWIRDRAFPVRDAGGVVLNVAGVAEDITERKARDEEARRGQKLEGLALLARGVAHSLGNVLTVLWGAAENLSTEATSDQAREAVGVMVQAVDRASSLTRELQALGRREALHPITRGLNSILRENEIVFRDLLGKDVGFELELVNDELEVCIDPTHWISAIKRLLAHTKETAGAAHSVIIRTLPRERMPTDGAPSGEVFVVLEVIDEGVSVPPERCAQMFDAFVVSPGGGIDSGLGLAVAQGIIEQGGGSIAVQSKGGSTTFRIWIPAAMTPPPPSLDAPLDARTTGRILIAEDDLDVRTMARHALEREGFRVLEASNGHDALSVLEEQRGAVALVVTDIVMPGGDGWKLLEQARVRYPATRFICTSGYAITEETTAASILQKPFSPHTLLAAVRRIVDAGPRAEPPAE